MADRVIHWFRRDLRLEDNTALHHALLSGNPVVPVFILDDYILRQGIAGEHRLRFLRTALADLDHRLQEQGSRLVVRHGDAARELNRLAEETECWAVYFNRDHTPYARQRDSRATRGLQLTGVVTQVFDDLLLVPPPALMDEDGGVPLNFDAFSRRWFDVLDLDPEPLPDPEEASFMVGAELPASVDAWPEILAPGLRQPSPWPGATPTSAQERLRHFAADSLAGYERGRDQPGEEDGTSRLSAALKFGTISVRDVARAALRRAAADSRARTGAERFVRKLAWRDYAAGLLQAHPDLLQRPLHEPSGAERLGPPAEEQEVRLQAWVDGRTGLPLVDAGMRQLLAEGWMPHSVRRVVAFVLAHQMACDWRVGEEHFARYLVDCDLASNDMGWQSAVGVGVDAEPERPSLNPQRQGEALDPEGEYVRRWVPELSQVPAGHVHRPWAMGQEMQAAAGCRVGIDYPRPIVPLAEPD
ncbi:MAG: deoxyribodipyrimidine photo-lyase [Candidatus Dormiibacterota bacterium]